MQKQIGLHVRNHIKACKRLKYPSTDGHMISTSQSHLRSKEMRVKSWNVRKYVKIGVEEFKQNLQKELDAHFLNLRKGRRYVTV